ncbi:type I restriction enzyme, S subunit [Franzmannia pantelleriensis]|uniref:Type I restriction enzyme, S subunit n=1 Tax=Franzmannia pantelleriensis TaxID=48727 RepID=A0A1G9HXN5_9GAMM|nr:restriction endonuclease subunit S [Halomonas pantelleriensis]SDL17728.1 type I restriction enzyme, S subunit [Halomonas pantelleriensis]
MFEPISELAEINPPLRAPAPDRSAGLISFIPMGDVSESGQWLTHKTRPLHEVKSGFTPFQEGDVLFAKITPCMENSKGAHAVGLENGIGYGSTEFHVLRAKADNSPRYIFHLSQSSSLRLKAEASMIGSAGQKRVPSEFFKKHRVFAPGAAEQCLIARILDTLDTQIQKTEALIAKLEKVKEGLLHDLLTRGIDEKGRLRPSPEQAPELYKESPLGLIPREWSVSTLGQRLSQYGGLIQTGPFGSQLHAEEYVSEGVPVVMPQDMRDIEVSKENIAQITEERAEDLARHRVGEGDLLFSRRGDLSRCSFMSASNKGWLCGTGCLLLRPTEHIDGFWLANIYKLSTIQSQVYGMAVGSTMVNLNSTILTNIVIPFPVFQEQSQIAEAIRSSKNKIFEEKNILSKLQLQKTGLMDDLLTGRVRVTPLLDQAQTTTPA